MDQQQNQQQVQIRASDADLKGFYSNVAQVSHTQEEFIVDFFNIVGPAGTLVSRLILSPAHMKRLAGALAENMSKYEASFGNVKVAEEPERKIGFKVN